MQDVCSILSVAFRSLTGMSALEIEPPSGDSLVVRLDEMLAELAGAVTDGRPTGDAARIDRIARLERLRAVTAALQAAQSRFGLLNRRWRSRSPLRCIRMPLVAA
jgi:hypothetical protein